MHIVHCFCADDTQVHIAKHVLKTVCTDVSNVLVNFLASDLMMSVENPGTITTEVRARLCSPQPETRAGFQGKRNGLRMRWRSVLWLGLELNMCFGAAGQSEDFGQTARGDQRASFEAAQLP